MESFPQFPNLPAELRAQIWHHALPPPPQNLLYIYIKGCWQPHLPNSSNSQSITYSFNHSLLPPAEFPIPLFFVNREARTIAHTYIHQQNLSIRYHASSQSLTFVRPFNAALDTLYVPSDKFNDFICEPAERQFEPDLLERNLGCPPPLFTRMAISLETLRDEDEPIFEFFEWFYGVEKVFVVLDAKELESGNESKVQPRWEMELEESVLSWDGEEREFVWRGRRDADDHGEVPYELMEYKAAGAGLRESIEEHQKESFEIWPARAVMR